jgi:hypothetical protein
MVWPVKGSTANRRIGERQVAILRRAAWSQSGQVIINPKDNADWCAAKRLVARGLLERQAFGGKRFGTVVLYRITGRGETKLREATTAAQPVDKPNE